MWSGVAGAQGGDAASRSTTDYRRAVEAAQKGQPGAIERAFGLLDELRRVFVERPAGQQKAVLEQLSEDRFGRLQQELPGTVVFREEIIGIEPEVRFWIDLSLEHGTATDREFFQLWQRLFGDGIWPAYTEQQTDYSGCTLFGNGALTDAYARWTSFQRSHPRRYVKAVEAEVERAAQALTTSTCACGTKQEVAREFALFLRRFPRSAIAPDVRRRSKAVDSQPSAFRFQCVSG
jgi:hypothetical protein